MVGFIMLIKKQNVKCMCKVYQDSKVNIQLNTMFPDSRHYTKNNRLLVFTGSCQISEIKRAMIIIIPAKQFLLQDLSCIKFCFYDNPVSLT